MLTGAAWLYAGLAIVVALFQAALALGAPWGHLAMGGLHPGRFPPALRIAAFLQGALILFLAVVVLGRAGLVEPRPPNWLFTVAIAVIGVTTVLNLITRSIPERRLWGPVTLVMFVCVLRVAAG